MKEILSLLYLRPFYGKAYFVVDHLVALSCSGHQAAPFYVRFHSSQA